MIERGRSHHFGGGAVLDQPRPEPNRRATSVVFGRGSFGGDPFSDLASRSAPLPIYGGDIDVPALLTSTSSSTEGATPQARAGQIVDGSGFARGSFSALRRVLVTGDIDFTAVMPERTHWRRQNLRLSEEGGIEGTNINRLCGIRPQFNVLSTEHALAGLAVFELPLSSASKFATRARQPLALVIWGLVERQQVAAARQLLDLLPDDPQTDKLKMLLRPPTTARATKRDRSRSAEFQWLRQHRREFVGQWVAVDGDELLSSARSLRELRKSLKAAHPTRVPLLHFVE